MSKRFTRLTDILLQQHGAVVLLLHTSLVSWSLLFAWLVRYDFSFKGPRIVIAAAPILVLMRLASMSRFNLLHGHWRYTDIDDAAELAKAIAVGSLAFFVAIRLILRITAFPLSVFIIEALLTGCLQAAVRLGFRVMAEASARVSLPNSKKQVVIIGAGFAAQMILRELRRGASGYWVVGCLDDDPTKRCLRVLGKPVLGTVDDLERIAVLHAIDEVLIAVPSATGAQMRRFVNRCELARMKFSTVPALQDLISGKAKIHDLREVDLNDLLGREPVQIDLAAVSKELAGKVVMVTGAAGSIGSELCRQILQYRPAKLVCLDQSETGLFYLQMEFGDFRTHFCVGDYTDGDRMRRVFATQGVQIVFHAAAYKHVPLMEANPREALQNNVFGLNRFLDIADVAKCEAFILISSDKAVNPTSMMGCSKRIGELLLSSRPASRMRCVSVRFGNVLGSQGSVVPVFQKQLAENRPITLTHPDITRFFMTIQEAVSLVLQASAIGKHREILVLDMGEAVRIVELARTLIRLSGKSEKDVAITFTGLRPGEKLYEELFYEHETAHETTCAKIKQTRSLDLSWRELKAQLEDIRLTMYELSDQELRAKVARIIPEYVFQTAVAKMGRGYSVPHVAWRPDPLPQYLSEASNSD
jgi:FlaA1/EpsC-like NDP-sugar epimerase